MGILRRVICIVRSLAGWICNRFYEPNPANERYSKTYRSQIADSRYTSDRVCNGYTSGLCLSHNARNGRR
ncbi:hypothetical protein M0804_007988 [Polistes exclamans]|nr:hypothetical protein M0804_007988 [Polistes exclamans]